MIQAKTSIANTQQASNNDAEFFTAENKIVPIRRITHQSITQIEDFREEQIIPEQKVKAIIREKKTSNPFAKFFKNALKYVDKLEDFIDVIQKLQLKSVVQKKILLQSEKTDQTLRTYQSKRIVKDVKESKEDQEKESVNLKDNPELGSMLAAALGLGAADALITPGGDVTIHEDVVSEGEFAVQAGTNVSISPAWIPFPKGTSGLIYNSGYGMRLNPVTGQYRQHAGIDVAGPVGAPIITPISGVVSFAGDEGDGYGYKVVITSGQLKMLFGHMYQPPPVRGGQQVQAGTVIGGIGSTGLSTGPHLHWNVYVNGSTVNPVDWTHNNPPGTATAGARSVDGPPLDNESEGGINQSRRIMVGEAGKEFVVPMSQMPLFIQGMLEEKIKCLNPYYQGTASANAGFETSSGSAQTKFADGAVVIPYNQNHYTTAKKLKTLFPQAKDYHIAAAMGNFETESTGTYPNRYQGDYATPPKWTKPGSGPGRGIAQWEINHSGNNFNGRWAQGTKKFGPSLFTDINKQLDFVKWEMDSNTRYLPWGNATKREWLGSKDLVSATKNFLEGYEAPSIPHMEGRIARAKSFYKNMKKLLGGSSTVSNKVPIKPKEETNIFKRIMNMISLDNVENQMQISKDYQNQFSFENSTNEIVAFYKPTVYYSEVS